MINRPNQNIIDLAIMATGSVEGLFSLCEANNIMPDMAFATGATVTLPTSSDADILNYLSETGIVVATGEAVSDTGLPSSFSEGFTQSFES